MTIFGKKTPSQKKRFSWMDACSWWKIKNIHYLTIPSWSISKRRELPQYESESTKFWSPSLFFGKELEIQFCSLMWKEYLALENHLLVLSGVQNRKTCFFLESSCFHCLTLTMGSASLNWLEILVQEKNKFGKLYLSVVYFSRLNFLFSKSFITSSL